MSNCKNNLGIYKRMKIMYVIIVNKTFTILAYILELGTQEKIKESDCF